jgi:putative DNA-invertase from lambdoid prophage Rac
MSATAQAQAEATKAAQRARIEHTKADDGRAYLGRKPSYTREQFNQVREMLRQQAVGIGQIARHTKLTRQTIYRTIPLARRPLWRLGDCRDADSSHSEGQH